MVPLARFLMDLTGLGPQWAYALAGIIAWALPILLLMAPLAGLSTYIERKLAAQIQQRMGPNWMLHQAVGLYAPRAGNALRFLRFVPPFCFPGIMQFLADGIKLLLKEDLTPRAADATLFKLAPYIVIVGSFASVAVVPFSDDLVAADLNLGVFYILAVTSMVVVGILMAGWGSNNKWSLLGGMRSAAQIISYEIPVGLAVMTAVIVSGSMNLQDMIRSQSGWFWHWGLLKYPPLMLILFGVYYLASLAECNRTPFDIPEAESELVSGYHTEYSGMRFAFFFMGEYIDMFIVSVIAVCIFLGGYFTGIPFLDTAIRDLGHGPGASWLAWLIGRSLFMGVFIGKAYSLVLIQMWIRWTWPRFRVDQMMALCWTKLVPITFACLFGVCAWMALLGA